MGTYAETLDHNANMRNRPKNQLAAIELKKADNGGVVAQHRMTQFDGKEPVHAFGKEEGHMLAAHLEKHLGIKMPVAAPTEEPVEDEPAAGE